MLCTMQLRQIGSDSRCVQRMGTQSVYELECRGVTFAEAIKEATSKLMNTYPNMHIFGLGASYPNGLDGTMGNIAVEHPERVHDTPCSEAAVTGMAMGAAISGIRSLVHHG